MQYQRLTTEFLAILVVTFWLAACGGGGGGDGGGGGGGNTASAPQTFYGFFIDDAVQGLIVESASGTMQTTDENGVFSFKLNDELTFKIDDVVLGTLPSGLEVVHPGILNGPNLGTQVFRFVQSMDTTPGTPGIDLTGLDLPNQQINFSQQNSFFENDPAVIAALAASTAAGASGVLLDFTTARNNFLAATNRIIIQADFENLVAYPVSAPGPNEPCLVFFNANLTGQSICRDDIAADPANATENFTWSVVGAEVVADIDVDTRTTITKNGTTANRIHARVATECLTCNPNLGPTIETELQTFYTAIPISAADFNNQSFNLSGAGGRVTATFNVNGSATFSDGISVETAQWSIDPANNVLLLQGTGTPGSTFSFVRAILIDGNVANGEFAVLNASVFDSNNNGVADQAEFDMIGVYDGIEVQTSTP